MNNFNYKVTTHPYHQLLIDNKGFSQEKADAYLAFKARCNEIKKDIAIKFKKAEKEMSEEEFEEYKKQVYKEKEIERQTYYAIYAKEKAEIEQKKNENYADYCKQKLKYNTQKEESKGTTKGMNRYSNGRKGVLNGNHYARNYVFNRSIAH